MYNIRLSIFLFEINLAENKKGINKMTKKYKHSELFPPNGHLNKQETKLTEYLHLSKNIVY